MKTRINLFIDTNIFIQQHFDFSHGRLLNLSKLFDGGFVNLYITEIIDKEIVKNIKEIINNEFSKAKTIQSIHSLTKQDTIDKCIEMYENYKNNYLTVVPCFKKDISKKIFDKYFNSEPPFDTKKEKKKYEFPDAFSIETINNWLTSNMKTAIFLSSDQDFKSYIDMNPQIQHETNIAKLLNTLNQQSDLYNKALDTYNILKDDILNQVKSDIMDLSQYDYDVYFYSQREYMDGCYQPNCELYDVIPDEYSFNINQACNILDLDIEENRAELEIGITYEVDAYFEESNYEFAIYDKEDNKYYGVEYNTQEGKYLINLDVYVNIDLKRKKIAYILYDAEKPNPQIRFFEKIDKVQ